MKKNKKVEANVVRSGMYYYSDGTISSEIISGKCISGVVGWVNDSGQHGLVLGLRETELRWLSDYLIVGAHVKNGKENTRLILETAQKQNKKAEAAEWCAAYAFDGVRVGEAFLPSREELVEIFKNFGAIQEALEKINQPRLKKEEWHWSSSERNNYDAWYVRPSDGNMYGINDKNYSYCVRCVLAF